MQLHLKSFTWTSALLPKLLTNAVLSLVATNAAEEPDQLLAAENSLIHTETDHVNNRLYLIQYQMNSLVNYGSWNYKKNPQKQASIRVEYWTLLGEPVELHESYWPAVSGAKL